MPGFDFLLAVLSSATLEMNSILFSLKLWWSLHVPEADR